MKEAAGRRGSIHLATELSEEFALVRDVIEDHLANLLGSLRIGSGERVFSPMVRAGYLTHRLCAIWRFHGPESSLTGGSACLSQPPMPDGLVAGDWEQVPKNHAADNSIRHGRANSVGA